MIQQATHPGGIMNSFKWAVFFILIALCIAGNYYYAEQTLALRLAGSGVLGVIALVVASQTVNGKRFLQFAQESRTELRRVVWPNRKETVQTTLMVLGVVAIVGLILWGVDILLLKVIAWLIGYGA